MDEIVALHHCHIIPQAEPDLWTMLKDRHWIPEEAKDDPRHEPRDGLSMCATHHLLFDVFNFFIRYHHVSGKFISINYSGAEVLEEFHGKAVALDINDRYAPFPSIFIIHAMRVPSNSFIRDLPPANNEAGLGGSQPQLQSTTSAGGGRNTLELNADVINTILAATRAMPSWKACQIEGTSWDGTAEENIQKYASVVGAQDSPPPSPTETDRQYFLIVLL
ncbi:hypothetical protein M422DRAFT_28569 [Sphaerobolus stellatus SS14]|uniref:HNH nuclease domain-containing protein n=1 Tax=Sphaerobolus stellatus (strain SS14) TaxID=990650 RepID=A0A0C9VJD6_SPHS4|nr:hypothetical protein M422DRAFT_28569 [Sphaerobolus stellatus SS14]